MENEQLSFIDKPIDETSDIKKFKPMLSEGDRPKHVNMPRPPKGIKLLSKEFWCPYCAKRVLMSMDKYLGLHRCPLCGISENDYYFKAANVK